MKNQELALKIKFSEKKDMRKIYHTIARAP